MSYLEYQVEIKYTQAEDKGRSSAWKSKDLDFICTHLERSRLPKLPVAAGGLEVRSTFVENRIQSEKGLFCETRDR